MSCILLRVFNLICILTFLFMSASCASKTAYQDAVSANRNNIQQLQLGMSGAGVARVMGEGELVSYRRIRLSNPWRSEAFILKDEGKTRVRILYYLTEPQRRWRTAGDGELTPVVLENDQVVGWGWSYLRRNMDRYAISVPLEQR